MLYLPISLFILFSSSSTIILVSVLSCFYSILHNFIICPPRRFYSLLLNFIIFAPHSWIPSLSTILIFPQLLLILFYPPPPQFLLFSLLNLDFPPPPQFCYFPSSTSTSSCILYIFPSTNTSTSYRPYIDPTSTLHRPYIDPTSTLTKTLNIFIPSSSYSSTSSSFLLFSLLNVFIPSSFTTTTTSTTFLLFPSTTTTFLGYRNNRFCPDTNPYISNVTQQCRIVIFGA